MSISEWLDLQLFAEGGDGGAGTAATGVDGGEAPASPAAGGRTLEELGVPPEKARRHRERAQKRAARAAAATATKTDDDPTAETEPNAEETAQKPDAAAADPTPPEAPKPSLEELIKQNPEYGQEIARIVAAKLKSKTAESAKLTQSLDTLAKYYGLDSRSESFYDELNEKIAGDENYHARDIDRIAQNMGVSRTAAKHIEQLEREKAERDAQDIATNEQQLFERHMARLRAEADTLRAKYPSFDFDAEMQNPRFNRLLRPSNGLSVEQAYRALHGAEIEQAMASQAAERARQTMAAAVQANKARPVESGAGGQSAARAQMPRYSELSKAEREAVKARFRNAAARGIHLPYGG